MLKLLWIHQIKKIFQQFLQKKEFTDKLGEQQKDFRESFGFGNPVVDQAYNIVDFFGKGKQVESNEPEPDF